mgnify:CR=1 FL=1
MRTKDVEKMILGSVKELIKDRNYFHNSTVGPEYCHLTDAGNQAVLDMINLLGGKLRIAIEQEDIERSKALVLKELQK